MLTSIAYIKLGFNEVFIDATTLVVICIYFTIYKKGGGIYRIIFNLIFFITIILFITLFCVDNMLTILCVYSHVAKLSTLIILAIETLFFIKKKKQNIPHANRGGLDAVAAIIDYVPIDEGDESRLYGDLYRRLKEYFDVNKPYLDKNLSIMGVSKALYTNKQYLSKSITMYTGKNFCQYVNAHRIRYSIQLFEENPELNVSDLADASGYNSVSSYSTSFRLFLNIAPRDWFKMAKLEHLKQNKILNSGR